MHLIVDQHRQRRPLYEVLDHIPTKEDVQAFLRRFRRELDGRGLTLRDIATDGSPLYPEAVAAICPGVTHQIFRFHLLRRFSQSSSAAKARKALRCRIPKRPRGRPSASGKRAICGSNDPKRSMRSCSNFAISSSGAN